MTVLDAILAAGGLTQFASGNRPRIERFENDKRRVNPLDDPLPGPKPWNIPLKSGDVLVVPQSIF